MPFDLWFSSRFHRIAAQVLLPAADVLVSHNYGFTIRSANAFLVPPSIFDRIFTVVLLALHAARGATLEDKDGRFNWSWFIIGIAHYGSIGYYYTSMTRNSTRSKVRSNNEDHIIIIIIAEYRRIICFPFDCDFVHVTKLLNMLYIKNECIVSYTWMASAIFSFVLEWFDWSTGRSLASESNLMPAVHLMLCPSQ